MLQSHTTRPTFWPTTPCSGPTGVHFNFHSIMKHAMLSHPSPTHSTFARRAGLCRPFAAAMFLLFFAAAAQAHTEGGLVGGFLSGFMHPLSGLDHLLAMLAVGI